jgi:signal transduction histidine kinase
MWGRGDGEMVQPERVPQYLAVLTGALTVVLLVEISHQLLTLGPLTTLSVGELPWPYIVSFLITLPFLAGIGFGARYLAHGDIPAERYGRIFRWCLLGAGVWLLVNVLTMLSFGLTALWGVIGWIRGALAFGAGFGLAIGIFEARAITEAVKAEQARLRTKHLGEQRDLVDYVNSLIRHEVLNSVNVIHGHATLLAAETDEYNEHVEPIVRRSEDVESVVRDMRIVMESVHSDPELESTNLERVIRAETTKAHDLDPDAEISVDVPEGTRVYTDGTLGLVFGNLLTNAVEHAGGDVARVHVTATVDDDTVEVRVTDDGPGIAPETRRGLFERPESGTGDHGYGLYLVRVLCEQCGGEIELTDTGPEGTTFTVTLQRATDESTHDQSVAAPPPVD